MDSPDVFVMASDPESGKGNLKCLTTVVKYVLGFWRIKNNQLPDLM